MIQPKPETSQRQKQLDARADRLLRRLRRLQTRQAISHARQQMTGFVDYQHRNMETVRGSKSQSPTTPDLKAELFQRDVKKLSTATLVNLVQKLQSSQPMTLRQHLAGVNTEGSEQEKIMRLDDENCMEFERMAGHLSSNLHHLERAVDSDATESSSGGESCDEMDYDYDWDGRTQPKPSITQRAEWKWAVERAAVASRWTWLQAQVSDLEYRIRQQNDIYRQIRASKGAVILGEQVQIEDLVAKCRAQQQAGKKLSPLEEKLLTLDRKNMSPSDVQQLLNNVARQSSQLAQQVGNFYSPEAANGASKMPSTPNGFVDNGLVGASTSHGSDADRDRTSADAKRQRLDSDVDGGTASPQTPGAMDTSCQAARCRPVRSYRKRKLLRTPGLHLTSRKASRLSTVRCHCFPPVGSCAMCGGRYNNVLQLEPDGMPLAERVSLLDPSFHPVLSFTQDIPLSIHFESLLKTGEWQHKQPLRHLKNLHKLQTEKQRRPKQQREGVRKYTRRINKSASAAILSSARIKNKYESHKSITRRPDGSLVTTGTPKKTLPERTRTRMCRTDAKQLRKIPTNRREAMREMNRLLKNMDKSSSAPGTPSNADHLSQSGSFSDLRRRRGLNAFDINNIVIPYSMAASTRVEKLQYKEIITPKWREILEKFLPAAAANTLKKKLMKRDLNASDSSTDTADSGPDFLLDSAPETPLAKSPLAKSPTDTEKTPPADVKTEPKAAKSTEPTEQVKVPKPAVEEQVKVPKPAVEEQVKVPKPAVEEQVKVPKPPVEAVCKAPVEAVCKPKLEEPADAAGPPKAPQKESMKTDADSSTPKAQKITERRASSTSSSDTIIVEHELSDEFEDLSEESHHQRHLRCEIREKKKFMSYMQMQRRGRGSRTESGTHSPGPDTDLTTMAAPASTSHSVAATPPATPKPTNENEDEGINRSASFSSMKSEDGTLRRRASSASKGSRSRSMSQSEERTRQYHHEAQWVMTPWPRRAFPLCETEIEVLSMERPPTPPSDRLSIVQHIPGTRPVFRLNTDTPTSPLSSASDVEEDPNDPEWTVITEKNNQGPKPCLVLKLAKR